MTTPIPGSAWSTTAAGGLVESVSLIDSAGNAVGTAAVALLASASRTTTQTPADQTNGTDAGLHVILDVTTVGTGSVTLSINGKDPASGKYYPLLTGAAVVTNSTNVYRVGRGLTAAANTTANDLVPRTFQIVVTANNANAVTYSVGYNLTA